MTGVMKVGLITFSLSLVLLGGGYSINPTDFGRQILIHSIGMSVGELIVGMGILLLVFSIICFLLRVEQRTAVDITEKMNLIEFSALSIIILTTFLTITVLLIGHTHPKLLEQPHIISLVGRPIDPVKFTCVVWFPSCIVSIVLLLISQFRRRTV